MTDKTFTFTIEQIKQIYDAGVNKGFTYSADRYDDCVQEIHYILNEGKTYGDPDYADFTTVVGWFKETE